MPPSDCSGKGSSSASTGDSFLLWAKNLASRRGRELLGQVPSIPVTFPPHPPLVWPLAFEQSTEIHRRDRAIDQPQQLLLLASLSWIPTPLPSHSKKSFQVPENQYCLLSLFRSRIIAILGGGQRGGLQRWTVFPSGDEVETFI